MASDVAALTAAYTITRDHNYADAAERDLATWFLDARTRMHPDLRFARAVHGVTSGRAKPRAHDTSPARWPRREPSDRVSGALPGRQGTLAVRARGRALERFSRARAGTPVRGDRDRPPRVARALAAVGAGPA